MSTPSEQITTNIPSWLKDAMLRLVGQAQGLTDLEKAGYQQYGGQRVAEFSPLQLQAFKDIAGMQMADQIRQATGMAGLAGLRAEELAKYTPAAERQFYKSPTAREMDINYRDVTAPGATNFQMQGPERVGIGSLQQYRVAAPERIAGPSGFERVTALPIERFMMGPAERVGAERFGAAQAAEYMSPYVQNVIGAQKRAAEQDYLRQLPGLGASAARVGGRGGTREALLQAEARRGLAEKLSDIEATGLQSAYQQAQQQFGADRAAQIQTALANQAAGLTTGQQNLQAALNQQALQAQQALESQRLNQAAGMNLEQLRTEIARANQAAGMSAEQANQQAALQVQQLGTQSGLQAALANQQMGYNVAQQNLQSQINQAQFAAQQAMQAGQLNQAAQLQAQAQKLQQMQSINQFNQQNAGQLAQYGLAGANLAEQSRQFGAGLGMQGIQQQLAAAGALGGLGMQQYQQQMGINQAQLGAGGQMQALQQELLNQQYQDFINKQQFPYQQLEFMSGILRGLPSSGQSQTMYQRPPSMFNQIAGLGLMGLGGLFGTTGGTQR